MSDRSAEATRLGPVHPACVAAVEVGHLFGIRSDHPVVIHETNNTVVWLHPHPVIAKVGMRPDSAEGLVREHEVSTALSARGAPVAGPLTDSSPQRHPSTGYTVTLWNRLDHDPSARSTGPEIGQSLRQVHQDLERSGTGPLPDFRLWLTRARSALSDDELMAALGADDIEFLRTAFDALLPRLVGRAFLNQSLHGEPHAGNYLVTPSGIRWIDFEAVCRGPLEWDIAFLPDDAWNEFAGVDPELVSLLSILNSARVATWCAVQARFPEMRRYGQHHLELVKANWPDEL